MPGAGRKPIYLETDFRDAQVIDFAGGIFLSYPLLDGGRTKGVVPRPTGLALGPALHSDLIARQYARRPAPESEA